MFCSFVRTLTIASGASTSETIENDLDAEAYLIFSPATLDALDFNIDAFLDDDAGGGATAYPMEDVNGDLVTLGAAGRVKPIQPLGMNWRIKASGNVAADRVFKVYKYFRSI